MASFLQLDSVEQQFTRSDGTSFQALSTINLTVERGNLFRL